MARKNRSRMTPETPSVNGPAASEEDVKMAAIGGAYSAKVTLVKPVQEEETSAGKASEIPLTLTRPKIGRARGGKEEEKKYPTLTATDAQEEKATAGLIEKEQEVAAEDVLHENIATGRAWDVKFAILLVTLFVAVNLGLTALLSHNHKARMADIAAKETTAASVASVAPSPAKPVLASQPTTSVVAPAVLHTAPLAAALPPAPTIDGAALKPLPQPAAAAPASVVANVPAPAAVLAPAVAPVAVAVPAASAAVVAEQKPVISVSPKPAQGDLLSIVGKD